MLLALPKLSSVSTSGRSRCSSALRNSTKVIILHTIPETILVVSAVDDIWLAA